MSLEIVAGLLGSQLVRAVGTMARPTPARTGVQPVAVSVREAPALYALPTVEVLSAVPGRARLRVQGIRDDEGRATESAARVQARDGVRSADANSTTGTILVRFD